MAKGSSKLKKAIDKIVNPAPAKQDEGKTSAPTAEESVEQIPEIAQPVPDLGQKTMPGILALRKKFGK
jgi:hypothetical protein